VNFDPETAKTCERDNAEELVKVLQSLKRIVKVDICTGVAVARLFYSRAKLINNFSLRVANFQYLELCLHILSFLMFIDGKYLGKFEFLQMTKWLEGRTFAMPAI